MICLNNLHSPINYTYEKAQVTREEKEKLVQILNFLDVNVILNSKNEIFTNIYDKDTNTYPESCKKNGPRNLAKIINAFVIDPEKAELRLNELRIWLKNNRYPDHIISNAFYNAKLQVPAPEYI